jgi:hypothetical protein
VNILALTIILVCTPTALLDFAMPKWKADKNVRIEDAYKWIYQATRGGEHAVPDRAMAKEWLDGEWSSLAKPTPNEKLWEPLCPGEEIGRINLRAFRAAGGKEDVLLDAFLESSAEYRSTGSDFTAAWNELGKRLGKASAGNLTKGEWTTLDNQTKAKDYPAIHHSKGYETAARPAYRVITKVEMLKLRRSLRPAS